MPSHKIIIGDSRKLSLLNDKSVHLIITSPPYWQLKDYGSDHQIGFHDSYEEYINNLNLVWQECGRVLADGCRLCINIGDQFARSVYYGRYKVIPIRTEIIRFCETIGFDYMGAIIWQKNTTMHTTGGGVVMGSFPYPRNGILKIDYEFILIFKKQGKSPQVSFQQKKNSILSKEEWNEYFASHWHFPGVKQDAHLAMFPEELPKRLIKMFSFEGETVFDPFLGSGTTSLAAIHTCRNSIGYEVNSDFLPVIKTKLQIDENTLFRQESTFIITEDTSKFDKAERLKSLPYLFSDPLKLNKNIEMMMESYGSKIHANVHPEQEEYFSVSQVLSPSRLQLNNGLTVKLIGISEKEGYQIQAVRFLQEKLKRQRVFFRQDEIKFTDTGESLCYLYLDNKTFINVHLLRTGLVSIDETIPFRLLKKFKEIIIHGN